VLLKSGIKCLSRLKEKGLAEMAGLFYLYLKVDDVSIMAKKGLLSKRI